MIDENTAMICAVVLMIAGALELAANPLSPRLLRYSGILAGFGFLTLGSRYIHLINVGDLSRLNIYGTFPIAAIALGRIIVCGESLKKWLP